MSILFKNIPFFYFFIFSSLFSVSAPPSSFEVEQPDGSKIPVRMFGHEYYNWVETVDGYVVEWVENEEQLGWYYSELDNEGKFTPSNILAVFPALVHLDIPKHLREISPTVRDLTHRYLNSSTLQNSSLNRDIITNSLKPLVFLVEFSDQEHEYTEDQFQHLLFAENLAPSIANFPSDHDNYIMSVRDYYDEISNGKQEIVGDIESVINWKTAENNYSYYVDSAQGTGEGSNGIARSAAALVVEIAMAIDEEKFSQFDNGIGVIDVVILIVAGQGGQSDQHFWPHMSVVPTIGSGLEAINPNAPVNSSGYFAPGGVVIRKYIVIQEKFAWNQIDANIGMIHPIGTFCHELGHVLGLPDLYDTSTNSASGIGEWGLMGSGNWQRQTSPAYMSAWSRYRLGFIDPIILDNVTDTYVTILPTEQYEEAVAYILPMNSHIPQEYLILENRQKIDSDQYLEESGLLVWHIDETITDMYPALNSVNVNPDFYGVNLLQADGQGDLYTSSGTADFGDPYPSGISTMLTGSTNPNTNIYSYDRDADGVIETSGNSNIEIIDIEESDGMITLIVSNPNKQGHILGYDEGNYEGIAFPKVENQLEWAGIRVVSPVSALLSGIKTVFAPTYSTLSEVTDYTINIWREWTGYKPEILLYTYNGSVQWDPEEARDGGWAYISLSDEHMIWNRGDEYYVEINYYGTGHTYFFDQGDYSNNMADGMSYYRSDIHDVCFPLSNQSASSNGDWNIRVVLSGQNCGIIEDEEIWPGDTDGDFDVDAEDIIPIGIYFGNQGCDRLGDAYSWESKAYPDGWENIAGARADANGDGLINIADILVILVNWGKTVSNTLRNNDLEQDSVFAGQPLEQYRDNFYQIYLSLSGSSEPQVLIREKLEELFGFSMMPMNYILGNNYPNPFNSRTIIPYYAPYAGEVDIIVYNVQGRVVNKFSHSQQQAGWHEVIFAADQLSSGIYFYRLISQTEVVSQNSLLLLK